MKCTFYLSNYWPINPAAVLNRLMGWFPSVIMKQFNSKLFSKAT